jgi:hypothetical protein
MAIAKLPTELVDSRTSIPLPYAVNAALLVMTEFLIQRGKRMYSMKLLTLQQQKAFEEQLAAKCRYSHTCRSHVGRVWVALTAAMLLQRRKLAGEGKHILRIRFRCALLGLRCFLHAEWLLGPASIRWAPQPGGLTMGLDENRKDAGHKANVRQELAAAISLPCHWRKKNPAARPLACGVSSNTPGFLRREAPAFKGGHQAAVPAEMSAL